MTDDLIPKAADTLVRVPALVDRYASLIEAGRATPSPATDDVAYPAGRSVWDMATAAWQSGGDNLLAWHHLLVTATVQPHAAQYTLVRGALEGAVTCRWLTDPYVAPERRRLRGAAAQLEDFAERRKFEESIGAGPFVLPAKSGADREADFKDLLIEQDMVPEERMDDFRTMGITDRCKHYALVSGRDGSWLYRVLSAYAHGMQWPLLAFGQIVEQIEAPSGDGKLVKLTARDGPVNAATIVAFMALDRALAELTWYAGRGPKLRRIKRRVT
ncbi:MAG TPA: hypothetical protein VM305_11920 [Candidatus Limnocylindrales bacterium]|jgi:hypothetical protein|nr:hypothetical protein [Candidatus Limnocylindrales bacterium]